MNIKAQRILNKHLNNVKVADSNTHIINAMKEFAEEYHKEQLRIGGVSQQRELLYAFANYVNNNELKSNEQITDYSVKKYIKSLQ